MAQRQCENCQKELNQGKRFCSKECYRLWREKPGFKIPNRNKFNKGMVPWNKGHGVNKICKECGKQFIVRPNRANTATYCSKGCAGKQRDNLAKYQKEVWKKKYEGGYQPVTSDDRLERGKFRKYIQKKVFERDNYTCQLCGERGGDLQVDHIQSWVDYIELRFCIDNCRTLCMKCHYQITFGKPMPPTVRAWGHNFSRRALQ